jgi:hypothetical protein
LPGVQAGDRCDRAFSAMSFLCCSSKRPALALTLALLEDRPESPAPPEDLRFPATLVASPEDFFLLAIRS